MMGDKHPNWQGGKSYEPYTSAFNKGLKESIRQRDGYKCQRCDVHEMECKTKLSIHHIDYVKANTFPSNLTSLCRSCNAKVNNDRIYWTKYFQHKMRLQRLKSLINWLPRIAQEQRRDSSASTLPMCDDRTLILKHTI